MVTENKKMKNRETIKPDEQTKEKQESFEDMVRALEFEIKQCNNDFKNEDLKIEQIEEMVGLDKSAIDEVSEELRIEERLVELNKKADELKENTSEKVEEVTVLNIIRKSKTTFGTIKTLLLIELLSGGAMIGKMTYTRKKEEMKTASEYLIKNDIKNIDTSKFFNDEFVSEVALTMKDGDRGDLIKKKEGLLSTFKSGSKSKIPLDKTDSLIFVKTLTEYEEGIRDEKKKLSKEEKETAKEKIVEIIALIEQDKLELIGHIQSNEYRNKLMDEMGISKKVAKEHQKTRIDNIKNINYELKTSWAIDVDTDGRGYAYFNSISNKIILPYNIDLMSDSEREYFIISTLHEILHQSTRAGMGLSWEVGDYFKNSFKQKDSTESTTWVDYFSNPVELIVRKQILDLKMEELGIKKYGEEFTEEHHQKLLELMKSGKLSQNETEFIDHIKPEKFVEIMNEIANVDNNGKKYFHPGWDYNEGEEDNLA